MKKTIIIFLMLPVFASGQFRDDFSDGDFTNDPAWTGDPGRFEITPNGLLHLASAGTDTSVLYTPNSHSGAGEWSFWLKLSFNTSANNHARVYLFADTTDLTSAGGVYVQVGGADDTIRVVSESRTVTGNLYSVKCYKTSRSTNTLRMKMICDSLGNWEVNIDTTGGTCFLRDGGFKHISIQPARYSGVWCRYTSSNAAKMWFDDFYSGPVIRDTTPPRIFSWKMIPAGEILLTYSENTDPASTMSATNYFLKSGGNPIQMTQEPPGTDAVRLVFSGPFPEGIMDTLRISGITDQAGNKMNDTVFGVFHYRCRPWDILIHEILADPEPSAGLPPGEFTELFNRTSFPIRLANWRFESGSYVKTLPDISIGAGGFLILCRDSAFSSLGNALSLFTSATFLSNEGTTLTLRDDSGRVVHSVRYDPAWYQGSFKEEGGWSLEMADPGNPCGCGDNWLPSKDPAGGTPGRQNSVKCENPDFINPSVTGVFISDSATLEITFSESMDSVSIAGPKKWQVSAGELTSPVSVEPVPPLFSCIKLHFGEAFKPGILYVLRIPGGLSDCLGNMADTAGSHLFAIPVRAEPGDIVINEILPDPFSGGSRFVELKNRSEKIVDISSLVISGTDGGDAERLCRSGLLFFPGDYAAFTASREDILKRYYTPDPGRVIQVESFPSAGNDSGSFTLARIDDQEMIDHVVYDSKMHFPLLSSPEGVSLERLSSELSSLRRDNWHSASGTAGYATPAAVNSQQAANPAGDGLVTVEPGVFTPDNDGIDDVATIRIRNEAGGKMVNISVYDSRGNFIRQLSNQSFTGSEAVFAWDGINTRGAKAQVGIYVIYVEMTGSDGTVTRCRETVVLGCRF